MNEDTQNFSMGIYRGSSHIMKQNSNTPYKGTPEDKLKILEQLDQKFEQATKLSSTVRGSKTLLYYTVFGVDYTMVLNLSLKSLIHNGVNKKFDLLLITDPSTLRILKTIESLEKFNWDYYTVPLPEDGIDASIVKTKIYSYPKISEYNKILFLDADVICRGDFSEIFNTPTYGKFEVVDSPLMRREMPQYPGLFKSAVISHSLSFFTEKNKEYILKNNPRIFNAGHFYFENTEQMEQHFNNIIWLISVWPSIYFYEQSFMNQYFNFNGLSSYTLLNKHLQVTMHVPYGFYGGDGSSLEKQHEDSHSLIHFAGTPTNGRNKFRFITTYCNRFNICL